MSKKNSFAVSACQAISKYSLYILIFLLPTFFLPITSDVLDFNKQVLLLFLVSISLFAWMFKALIAREVSINLNKTNIAVGVLLLVYAASTIFSIWRYGSFWGWPQVVSESLITLIGLCVFYFLVTNIFNKKEVITSVVILAFSEFLVLLIGLLQAFGIFLIPFNFAKNTGFNTLGSLGNLGFFAIVLLPLIITLLAKRKNLTIIFSLIIIFSLVLLVLVNYPILWWLTMIGAALIMIFWMQKKDFFDSRLLVIPMFFLAVSLFFIVLKPSIGLLPNLPIEVYLTQKASLSIDLQTLKQNPILGSGPGTFVYDFSKYKNVDFNKSIFWNTKFDSAGSKILNVLGTTGILGLLTFLALIISVVYYGVKYFFIDKKVDEHNPATAGSRSGRDRDIILSIFAGFIVLAVGFFLRSGNMSVDFLYFFLIAVFIVQVSEEKKEYKFQASSLATLSITFAFTLLFIFGLGLLILTGQKYITEASYVSGLNKWQAGNIDAGLSRVEKAVGLNPSSDLYLRQLSQLYILKLTDVINNNSLAQEEKNKNIQLLVQNAVNASKIATDVNPKNVVNWSSRGSIFQNLIGVVPGSEEWAITSYDEAIKLDPNNPYYLTQKGIVYLRQALTLPKDKEGDKLEILAKAKEQLDRAVQLKPDYASALFQLAMVAQAGGKTEEAIKGLEETKKYAPQDIGVAFQLGLLYYQTKDYNKAQGEFERAIGISPNYSNALYFSGLTYSSQGQKTKAIERISKVLELNPENETIKKVLDNIKADKGPLEGVSQETPSQTPIKEEPK